MLNIIYTLLPIFLLIALGYYFNIKNTFAEGFWSGIEHLCFYVLFPALIIRSLALSDFDKFPAASLSYTMGFAVVSMLVIMSILYFPVRAIGMSGESYSSIFQGSTRWNTFAMLAIIEGFYGDFGVSIGAIGIAVMVPILNISNVIALAVMVGKNAPSLKNICLLIARNPFIIACLIGLTINFLDIDLWPPLDSMLSLLGRAALSLSLLAVGVGVSLKSLKSAGWPVSFAMFTKLGLMPVLMYFLGTYFGLQGMPLTIAILCGGAPTAAASFILSRKMGGDSPLMANIISAQTLLSIVTIPLILYIIGV